MTSAATIAMWVALSAASPQVLVIPYQALGVEEAEVERLAAALRKEATGHGWTPIDGEAAAKQARAAAMCGEDAECLATLGTRAQAEWVLGFAIGKVGKGVFITTLLVETASGKRKSGTTEKLVTVPEDWTNTARALVDPLFRDVPQPVVLAPGLPPEPPPMVQAAPKSPLGPAAAGVLIGAGVLAAGGVVLSVVAGNNFAALGSVPAEQRPAADATQRGLNVAADVTVGVAIAAAATGLVLLIAEAASAPKPAAAEEGGE